MNSFILFMCICFLSTSYAFRNPNGPVVYTCRSEESCGKCIQADPNCAFCPQQDYSGSRCDHISNLDRSCNQSAIIFPVNEMSILMDRSLGDDQDSVHLRPQNIRIKLRPKAPMRINIQYRQPRGSENDSLELKDTSDSSFISVKYFSSCNSGVVEERNRCENLQEGQTVCFDVEITAHSCRKCANDLNSNIQIYPVGLNESLTISIIIQYKCECENPENLEVNSEICSLKGNFSCGVCQCGRNILGRQCDIPMIPDESACKISRDSVVCSGRGICVDGECGCFFRGNREERTYGQFCECDNFSCERADGQLCGGPDRGICECGQCMCRQGWTGPACDCQDSKDTCLSPSGKICSGHGLCECGRCKCDSEEGRYSGPLCEDCPTCPGKCDLYKECVLCQMFQTGVLTEEQCKNCSFIPIRVEKIEQDQKNQKLCTLIDESDDCIFTFSYILDGQNEQLILAEVKKDCPEGSNIFTSLLSSLLGKRFK